MEKTANSPDLQLAFDVGHSSIGWAVLQTTGSKTESINILGCGAVTFRADDCLASARRGYRRQRRHIRSTRQRIARLKILLKHLGVLSEEQLNKPGCAWPWKLAAQVLRGGGLLTWPELWDVIRWYAHNRGYDGNRRWSAHEAEAQDEDTEKEAMARSLMGKHGTSSMAETFCAISGIDPLGTKKSCNLPGDKRPKGQNAAFPRPIVEGEVRRILQAHVDKLPKVDETLEKALLGSGAGDAPDWRAYEPVFPALYLTDPEVERLRGLRISRKMPKPEKERRKRERKLVLKGKLVLPRRYQGALLFGQLVPRFDNRIISTCPISGEKVPSRNCVEFLNFRWAMTLANIRIGFGNETYNDRDGKESKLRRLNTDERKRIDAHVRRLGFLKLEKDKQDKSGLYREGKNELQEILLKETHCHRHNLETTLLDPNAKEGLKLLPIDGDVTAFRVGWACFDEPQHDESGNYRDSFLRHRFVIQLLRQKKLTLAEMIRQLELIAHTELADRIRAAARQEASDKRGKVNAEKEVNLLSAEFFCPKLSGRARYSRDMLRTAFQQVFRKDGSIHPLESGGCLEQTLAIQQAAVQRELADQTNNHLVRHRLGILKGNPKAKRKRKPGEPKPGLLEDIIEEFAGGDKRRISRITIELARDLQEMSGMDNKAKKKALGIKLAHHTQVSADLAEKLRDGNGNLLRNTNGRPLFASPGLIRKARILDDLGNKCPYTGHDIEFVHLIHAHSQFGTADKDHIIPRSQRLSDALEAQVITFSDLNRVKGAKPALQFIREMNLPENRHHKDRFGIKTEAQFRTFVDSLWPKTDPFKRSRAGGPKATDDEARCWRRKELLLKAIWDGKEFTPADLAQTRHTVKLAAQQLESGFLDLPPEQRPPVITIAGSVTATFRDKSWKLLGELAAVHPKVKEALAQGAQAQEQGRDFNPKKTVRALTHLHHALDAVTLGLITSFLVPKGHRSLDGDLARLIVKGKLTVDMEKGVDELSAFRALCAKLRLRPFAKIDSNNRLHIDDLPTELKGQLRQQLSNRRVVQHIPADTSGLACDETVYHVFDPNDTTPNARRLKRWFEKLIVGGEFKKLKSLPDPNNPNEHMVLLTARKRKAPTGGETGKLLHDTGKDWRWTYVLTAKDAIHGLNPDGNSSRKLADIKAAKLLGENFGVAAIVEPGKPTAFEILRPRKVWTEIADIRRKNPNAEVHIIRKGALIRLTESDGSKTMLRIFGCGERPGRGIYFDAGDPDAIEREREIQISAFASGRAMVVETTYTGVSSSPAAFPE